MGALSPPPLIMFSFSLSVLDHFISFNDESSLEYLYLSFLSLFHSHSNPPFDYFPFSLTRREHQKGGLIMGREERHLTKGGMRDGYSSIIPSSSSSMNLLVVAPCILIIHFDSASLSLPLNGRTRTATLNRWMKETSSLSPSLPLPSSSPP